MVDLHSILATHNSKEKDKRPPKETGDGNEKPSIAEIPDLFFDQFLVQHKLTRIEVLVMMYLYRSVYCKPNLFKIYGLTPVMSHKTISENLNISLDDIYHSLRKLEELGTIETIRSGQYFVRKYFSSDNDLRYKQKYDNF
jgi:DNA-binding MarR family transcriptional regulator